MSDRFNCPIHGLQLVDNYNDGCPKCQFAEEDAARDREEIRKSLSEIARSPANLGDYVCPHCKQTSLKVGASRCPMCRGEIGGDYWSAVWAQEKADAERRAGELKVAAERKRAMEEAAAAELIRTAPERAAAARAAALAAATAAIEIRRTAMGKGIFYLVVGLVVGAIAGFIAGLIIGIPVYIVGGLWMNDSNAGSALATNVGRVVNVLGAAFGAYMGWDLGTQGTVLDTNRR